MIPQRYLSWIQRLILSEIVFGSYCPSRRDARTVRALERRGLVTERRDPAGYMLAPPDYDATEAGRSATLIDGGSSE